MTKIFLIAGEPSGDALGAPLLANLKQEYGENLQISGIGGHMMQAQGLQSLIPMEEICVMGIAEIIGHLPRLLKLINGVVEEIEKFDPDILITIDLPDFNFQVVQRLKKRGICQAKIIHYVAPTVWAWRPGRAKHIAGFLDGLMCLFPFEPPYFQEHNLPTKYVGHPLIERDLERLERDTARAQFDISPDELAIGVFLGSREEEVRRMSGVIANTVEVLAEQYPDFVCIIPTLPNLEFLVRDITQSWDVKPLIVIDPKYKYQAFKSCDVGIAVSGTVGLELGYLSIPHVILYKTSWLSYAMARLLVKTKFIHLENIILGQPVIPEYIQAKATPEAVTASVLKIIKSGDEKQFQKQATDVLRTTLKDGLDDSPSKRAVAFINAIMNNSYKYEENTVADIPLLSRKVPDVTQAQEGTPQQATADESKQETPQNILAKIWAILRSL